jgi:hypothetical protein
MCPGGRRATSNPNMPGRKKIRVAIVYLDPVILLRQQVHGHGNANLSELSGDCPVDHFVVGHLGVVRAVQNYLNLSE